MNDNMRIIEYEFMAGYKVPWLEDTLKEFNIETKESWLKIDEDEDWSTPSFIFKEPDYPDLYSITYTCLAEIDNPYHDFAESLIESLLSYTGYLEGCLQKEIDNKKGDTS